MAFSILLSVIASKFKKSVVADENFKKFLMGHECVVVIKTKDGKKGKRFIFNNGSFSTDSNLDQYDTAMVWKDAKTAFRAMKRGDAGIKEALQNHVVGIEGKVHSFTWFGAAIAFVMG